MGRYDHTDFKCPECGATHTRHGVAGIIIKNCTTCGRDLSEFGGPWPSWSSITLGVKEYNLKLKGSEEWSRSHDK